jgi:hypothetical protein
MFIRIPVELHNNLISAYKDVIEATMSDALTESAKAMLRLFRAARCEFLKEDFPGIVKLVEQDCQGLEEDDPLHETFVALHRELEEVEGGELWI